MSLTIENIVEQIPAVRAALAEDIQRRRHAVTAKRKELIDEITTVEELIRQFEPKCSEADARLIKALEDLDSARKAKNAVLEERAKLQATVSGNKSRLHREFGNDAVTTALYRVEARLSQCQAQATRLEQVIAAMNQPDSIYLPQDPSGNIQLLDDIRRQIVELEKSRLELLSLLQANDHPETIARSALSIAERLFGSERGDGGDDIA